MGYTLLYPPTITFGVGSSETICQYIPNEALVLLVVGNHVLKSESVLLDKLTQQFNVSIVNNISAEPPLEDVDRVVDAGRQHHATCVVAIGGGSVIDCAKAAAALIPLPGATEDYFFGKRSIVAKGLSFIALPTTAGTGAEITKNSVLTHKESKIKQSIRHPAMVADVAIIDPNLTLSATPALTAASGLDALTQAIESYTTVNANAVTRSLALKAVLKLFEFLPIAYQQPNNIDAKTQVAEGSLLSAMAFSQSGLGAVHGLAHPIGSLLSIPHGVTCAILLEPIIQWNKSEAVNDYSELAKACGFDDSAEAFANAITELCHNLNIETSFRKYGLLSEHFPFIIENCRSNSMKGNPRYMTDDDVEKLLHEML